MTIQFIPVFTALHLTPVLVHVLLKDLNSTTLVIKCVTSSPKLSVQCFNKVNGA